MPAPTILAISGSLRKESLNSQLLSAGIASARSAGATVTVPDLRALSLPLYDGDDEAARGLPDGVKRLKELFKSHQGLLFACPEYNSSITPFLKNVIDWASRPAPGEKPLECFNGKVCALLSASSGALGGLRGLVHVRAILSNINVLVIPDQFALGKAHEAFETAGSLKSEADRARVKAVTDRLVAVTAALSR